MDTRAVNTNHEPQSLTVAEVTRVQSERVSLWRTGELIVYPSHVWDPDLGELVPNADIDEYSI